MPLSVSNNTRRNILRAAFEEFYHNGFQGGSINHIVERTGATKGALFHHFADKTELGYAVVDEMIQPGLKTRWFDTLASSIDPIADVKSLFQRSIKEAIESNRMKQGCPLNNLAQEMSPLDEGFRKRINKVYADWRESMALAFARGIKAGTVRKDISADGVAAFIIAVQMGMTGTAKNSQNADLMMQMGNVFFDYLESLKP